MVTPPLFGLQSHTSRLRSQIELHWISVRIEELEPETGPPTALPPDAKNIFMENELLA